MLKVIDLFSGVGGLSYGFYNNEQFKIIGANEILSDMAKAYSLNHPDVRMYNKDISEFSADELINDENLMVDKIDILIGGPPCQAYSTVGKRLLNDSRGKLFQEFFRLLKEFEPKFFLYENVSGLLSMPGGLHNHIIDLFKSLSYKVETPVLNAVDYGIPQNRKRVIITGTKLEREFQYPNPTYSNNESQGSLFECSSYLTLGDAIGDLPPIPGNSESTEYLCESMNNYQKVMRRNAPDKLQDHNSPKNGQHLIKLMEALPEGGSPRDIPTVLRPKSGFGNTYCRLWWDKPSTTITRNLGTPSSSRCIHPKVARALTTREGARIQSFPDDFMFYGSRGAKNLQIGNAVPPILSTHLAKAILSHFMEH
jgi:DNA (cytosine-5)-methyltransferase 1